MTSSPSSTKSSSAISSIPRGDLGEVALERLLVLRLQVDAAAAPMCEAAKAIVLRLVLPAQVPTGSSSTVSASIGARSSDSGVRAVAIPLTGECAGNVLAEILLLAPEHNAKRAIRQRPLQCLRLRPGRVQPSLPLGGLGQDHRHRLGMDRRDLGIRRRGQEPEEIGAHRPLLDLPHRGPCRPMPPIDADEVNRAVTRDADAGAEGVAKEAPERCRIHLARGHNELAVPTLGVGVSVDPDVVGRIEEGGVDRSTVADHRLQEGQIPAVAAAKRCPPRIQMSPGLVRGVLRGRSRRSRPFVSRSSRAATDCGDRRNRPGGRWRRPLRHAGRTLRRCRA